MSSCVMKVALKTLVVIHRLLREGDPAFREEFLTFTQRVRILQLSNFKDDSSPVGLYFFNLNLTWCFIWIINILPYFLLIYCLYISELYPAWDCSSWVRTYGLFLEEKLECFRVLKYDIEAERLSKQGQGPEKVWTLTCSSCIFISFYYHFTKAVRCYPLFVAILLAGDTSTCN
jgi:hypothetical protein